MVRRLLNSQRREAMERIMVETARSYLEGSAREWGIEPPLNQADWQVTLDFYACGMAGLLLGSDRRTPRTGSGWRTSWRGCCPARCCTPAEN